jgi:hypothetical protein
LFACRRRIHRRLSPLQNYKKTFADRALTLRSQYLACSQGKLDFQPAPNSLAPGKIFGGVMDIQLNMKVTNLARQNLTNYAVAATQIALGADISEVVDNILFCHPRGLRETGFPMPF